MNPTSQHSTSHRHMQAQGEVTEEKIGECEEQRQAGGPSFHQVRERVAKVAHYRILLLVLRDGIAWLGSTPLRSAHLGLLTYITLNREISTTLVSLAFCVFSPLLTQCTSHAVPYGVKDGGCLLLLFAFTFAFRFQKSFVSRPRPRGANCAHDVAYLATSRSSC